MKRIIAFLAASAFIISAGCSGKETSENDSSAENVSVSSEASPVSEQDTQAVTSSDEEEMEEVIRNFYAAMKNTDINAVAKCSLPEEIAAPMVEMGALNGFFDGVSAEDLNSIDLSGLKTASVTDVSADENALLRNFISYYANAFRYLKENNIPVSDVRDNKLDDKAMNKFITAVGEFEYEDMITADLEQLIEIPAVKNVYFSGLEEMDGESIPMYKVDGEGWKVDVMILSMYRYEREIAQNNADSEAYDLKYNVGDMLIEMQNSGIELTGTGLICSDETKNKFSADSNFKDHMQSFRDNWESRSELFSGTEGREYFLLIHNGSCIYAAVNGRDCVGVSLWSRIPVSIGAEKENFEKVDISGYTYDDIYRICADLTEKG